MRTLFCLTAALVSSRCVADVTAADLFGTRAQIATQQGADLAKFAYQPATKDASGRLRLVVPRVGDVAIDANKCVTARSLLAACCPAFGLPFI